MVHRNVSRLITSVICEWLFPTKYSYYKDSEAHTFPRLTDRYACDSTWTIIDKSKRGKWAITNEAYWLTCVNERCSLCFARNNHSMKLLTLIIRSYVIWYNISKWCIVSIPTTKSKMLIWIFATNNTCFFLERIIWNSSNFSTFNVHNSGGNKKTLVLSHINGYWIMIGFPVSTGHVIFTDDDSPSWSGFLQIICGYTNQTFTDIYGFAIKTKHCLSACCLLDSQYLISCILIFLN